MPIVVLYVRDDRPAGEKGDTMALVKKSFNMDHETAHRLDDFIDHNPHMSLTLVMTEALKMWLNNPKIELKIPKPLTEEDVRRFNEENAELMEKLAE